jgi:NAD+ diphosphatase
VQGESIYKNYRPAISEERSSEDRCYWLAFCQNRLLVDLYGPAIPCLRSLSDLGLSPVRTQYLGTLKERPCYSAELAPGVIVPEGMSLQDLRSLYGALEDDIFLLAGRAIQIVAWDQTSQFCGRCGHRTEVLADERARKCPACSLATYPRISPAAITAVLNGNKILLSHNRAFRGNMYSLIAGFVEPGENLEECVRREILEEVGIQVGNIRYFGSQPWPFPNSLMVGFIADYAGGEISVDGKEISEAGWFDAHNLPELPSKMSIARKMIDWFVERNR